MLNKPMARKQKHEKTCDPYNDDITKGISPVDYGFWKKTGKFPENDESACIVLKVRAFTAEIQNIEKMPCQDCNKIDDGRRNVMYENGIRADDKSYREK